MMKLYHIIIASVILVSYRVQAEELLQAVWTHNAAEVARLLEANPALANEKDRQDVTALMAAVDDLEINIVKALIDAGANLNAQDRYGNTALFHAAIKANDAEEKKDSRALTLAMDIYDMLITAHADQTIKNNERRTVKQLQELMAQTRETKQKMNDARSDRTKKLFYVIDKPDEAEALELIKEGITVNEQDAIGRTPLFVAVVHNKLKIVKALINAGADVNMPAKGLSGRTPLMEAANAEITQALLDAKAHVNAVDYYGNTALILEAEKAGGDAWALKKALMLINAGADLTLKNNAKKTALNKASSRKRKNSEMKELLKKHGALKAQDI